MWSSRQRWTGEIRPPTIPRRGHRVVHVPRRRQQYVLVTKQLNKKNIANCFRSFSKRKVFEILLMGTFPHRESDWMIVLDLVKDVAKSIGASTISGTGRPGWARS